MPIPECLFALRIIALDLSISIAKSHRVWLAIVRASRNELLLAIARLALFDASHWHQPA
jgi:hypothetical protein